jgi:ribosomal protein S18 acetylase RimI-like enzyme
MGRRTKPPESGSPDAASEAATVVAVPAPIPAARRKKKPASIDEVALEHVTRADAEAQARSEAPAASVVPSAAPAKPKPKRKPRSKSAKPATKAKATPARPPLAHAEATLRKAGEGESTDAPGDHLTVRRMHRRDINRVWQFLKLSFRAVNRETVEYQRPRSKARFEEIYDDEGIEQLLFEVGGDIVGYAECAFEVVKGSDNWINPRYFDSRDMRPLFVEELATHPDYQGRGVGSFMLEQLDHLARLHGCTHLVLEVAENNADALSFYKRRNFQKLDAALFMAKSVERPPELLPPRPLKTRKRKPASEPEPGSEG